jgi:aspartyl protease family protein
MRKIIIFSILFLFTFYLESCNGCSRTRHRDVIDEERDLKELEQNSDKRNTSRSNEIIKMRKDGGVYYVPIEINGVEMEFIFDTGASIISLSQTEAMFLFKQGKLKEEDFRGTQEFMDANGDISEGSKVNLREVTIGNKTLYNIEASIVHNQVAPLLFGQSAMNKFGKITIDYNNNEITFN